MELIGINYITSPFRIGRVDKNDNTFGITTNQQNQQQPHSGYSGGFQPSRSSGFVELNGFKPPRSLGFVEFNGFKPPKTSGFGELNVFLHSQNSNITTANHQQQPLLGYRGEVQPPRYCGFNGSVQSQTSNLTTANLQQNQQQPFTRYNGGGGFQPPRYSGFGCVVIQYDDKF